MKICLVQADNYWESIGDNLEYFDRLSKGIPMGTDLVVLPELFSTGFSMTGEQISEPMDGKAVQWMRELSKERDCLVAGSVLISEGGRLFNRFIAALPDGSLMQSDKRHLFSFAGENAVFEAGKERLVFVYKGFRICPLICYDLRFPVWSRNTEEIDLLLYVANWPDARVDAWDTLIKARAIENMCYVVAVNRVGSDGNGLHYLGHSVVRDAMGKCLADHEEGKEGLVLAEIQKSHIQEVRNKFRFLDDRDDFRIL